MEYLTNIQCPDEDYKIIQYTAIQTTDRKHYAKSHNQNQIKGDTWTNP